MIRQIENDESQDRELILQIIINLSSDENFQNVFLDLNAPYRLCYLLFNRIDKEIVKEKKETEINEEIFDLAKYISQVESRECVDKLDIKYGI